MGADTAIRLNKISYHCLVVTIILYQFQNINAFSGTSIPPDRLPSPSLSAFLFRLYTCNFLRQHHTIHDGGGVGRLRVSSVVLFVWYWRCAVYSWLLLEFPYTNGPPKKEHKNDQSFRHG